MNERTNAETLCAHTKPSWDNNCGSCNTAIDQMLEDFRTAEAAGDLQTIKEIFAQFPEDLQQEMRTRFISLLNRTTCSTCHKWPQPNRNCDDCHITFQNTIGNLNLAKAKIANDRSNFIYIGDGAPQANLELYELAKRVMQTMPRAVEQWSANHRGIVFTTDRA